MLMILKDQLGFQICWWRTIVPDTYLHIAVIYQGERGAITGLCKIGQRMRELKKPLSNSCSQSYLKKHFQRSLVLPIPKLFFFFLSRILCYNGFGFNFLVSFKSEVGKLWPTGQSGLPVKNSFCIFKGLLKEKSWRRRTRWRREYVACKA